MFNFIHKLIAKHRLKVDLQAHKRTEKADIQLLRDFIKYADEQIATLTPELNSGSHTLAECKKILKQIRFHERRKEEFSRTLQMKERGLSEVEAKMEYALNH